MLARDNKLSQAIFMTCFYPKYATYQPYTKINEKTGEIYQTRRIKFLSPNEINEETPFQENVVAIPCQKCSGCLIDRSNDWATRAMLETKMHKENCFVTLTYDNEHLPKNRSLCKEDFQKFFKRLRKQTGQKIRYMLGAEYGPRTLRPHAHFLCWGYRPSDLKLFKQNKTEDNLYTSKELEKIWGKGYVLIGNITYESAAYVARYVYKKAFGLNKEWNTKHGRTPEFQLSSRRGGIGIGAFEKKEIWEQIKRNNAILIKTKNKVMVKKIPNFLKNKWKDLDNREEYFKEQDKRTHALKTIARERETSKNIFWYTKQIVEKLKNQYKRLDKRNQI